MSYEEIVAKNLLVNKTFDNCIHNLQITHHLFYE